MFFRRSNKNKQVKYYLYISDAKVSMLLPQIPGAFKKKIAAELRINVGVLSGKISVETDTSSNRVARLRTVEKYLLKHEQIGSLKEPTSWFKGEAFATEFKFGNNGNVVFFFIESDTYVVALGGSSSHLIGSSDATQIKSSLSHLPDLLHALEHILQFPNFYRSDTDLNKFSTAAVTAVGNIHPWIRIIDDLSESGIFNSVPKQKISFLAKQIVTQNFDEKNITLSTPIYVALED